MILENVSLMSDINCLTQLKRGYNTFSRSAEYELRANGEDITLDLYEQTYRIVFAWISLEIEQREKNTLFSQLLVCENVTVVLMSTDGINGYELVIDGQATSETGTEKVVELAEGPHTIRVLAHVRPQDLPASSQFSPRYPDESLH